MASGEAAAAPQPQETIPLPEGGEPGEDQGDKQPGRPTLPRTRVSTYFGQELPEMPEAPPESDGSSCEELWLDQYFSMVNEADRALASPEEDALENADSGDHDPAQVQAVMDHQEPSSEESIPQEDPKKEPSSEETIPQEDPKKEPSSEETIPQEDPKKVQAEQIQPLPRKGKNNIQGWSESSTLSDASVEVEAIRPPPGLELVRLSDVEMASLWQQWPVTDDPDAANAASEPAEPAEGGDSPGGGCASTAETGASEAATQQPTEAEFQALRAETERLRAADVAAALRKKEEELQHVAEELGQSRHQVARLEDKMNRMAEVNFELDNAVNYWHLEAQNAAATIAKQTEDVHELRKTHGVEAQSASHGKNNVAVLYEECQQFQEAEKSHTEICKEMEAQLGAEHGEFTSSKFNPAALKAKMGSLEEFETRYRNVLDVCEHTLWPGDDITLRAIANLADVLRRQDRLEEAEAMLKNMVQQAFLRRDDTTTLNGRFQLAHILALQGKTGEAETHLREVVSRREQKLGLSHPETLAALGRLAFVLECRNPGEASKVNKQIWQRLDSLAASEKRCARAPQAGFSLTLAELGEPEKEETLVRRIFEGRIRTLGFNHPETLSAQAELANILARKEGPEAAEESLALRREVANLSELCLGPEHVVTLAAKAALAGARAEAEPPVKERDELFNAFPVQKAFRLYPDGVCSYGRLQPR